MAKKYVTKFYNRDKDTFRAFNKCGNLDKTQLNKLGLTDTRIKNYCRDGLVTKVPYDIKGSRENGVAYKLTDKGKEVGANKFGLTNYAQSQSVRHNLDVANKYLSLTKQEQQTCINEREVRELVQDRIYSIEQKIERDRYKEMLDQGQLSMPDIVYVSTEGVTIGFDTITNNYGKTEIQAKEEACNFLEIQLETHKI